MTTFPKPAHSRAARFRGRAIVWLLVLVSGLAIVLAICLPRPGAIKAPEQAPQPPADIAGQDAPAKAAWDPHPISSRAESTFTEPMQKTPAGWVLDLESTNAEVVQAARKALAALGPDAAPAIPQLARMLNEAGTGNSAAWALVQIGTKSLPVLLDALTNGNTNARMEVAGAIGWLREDAEEAIPGLVECMKDDDSGVRGNAIAALQAIPKRPEIAVPALIAALADPEASVHDNADTVLRKYAKVEPDATIPMLVQAAQQSLNPVSIRFRAAEIVRAIAPERAKAEGL
jgi:HEAT repeat protein